MQHSDEVTFSGSYSPRDVLFLLKPVEMNFVDVPEKERLLQSGGVHYSEMLSPERPPSPAYMDIYRAALRRNGARLAADLLHLAGRIRQERRNPVLVSIARAGTPIGVLLARILREQHACVASHYSLSVIRDVGLDLNALQYVVERERSAVEDVVFIDGWTGKGGISRELGRGVREFNARHEVSMRDELFVVVDLCNTAAVSATAEDYLVPCSILNATVSGLVSRSVLPRGLIGADDFHGCVHLRELAPWDISVAFVEEVMEAVRTLRGRGDQVVERLGREQRDLIESRERFLLELQRTLGLRDQRHLRPGIGETTRVLLRRVPEKIYVRDHRSPEVNHLLVLASAVDVEVLESPKMPYEAIAVVRRVEPAA